MNGRRLALGIAHPRMGRGGSESRVMWTAQAMKDDFDVSLITTGSVDLPALNACYGTCIAESEMRIIRPRLPLWLQDARMGSALRGAIYWRLCRRAAQRCDILVSAYNPCDFGVPAIQCIADFSWDDEIRRRLHPTPPGASRILHEQAGVRRLYGWLAQLIEGRGRHTRLRSLDMIISNSQWSAGIIREKYGLDSQVLYPPVTGAANVTPLSAREPGFVCIGRISPEKRIERIVEILRAVRRLGQDVHLHVVGDTAGSAYGRQIASLCASEREWIFVEGPLYGEAKTQFLGRHRYGIHACQGEAFGIAVAEMVKAGCITFAPAEGGQAEVVNHPALLYGDSDSAIKRIGEVLRSPEQQAMLHAHMLAQGARFSQETFMAGMRRAVNEFVSRRGSAEGASA